MRTAIHNLAAWNPAARTRPTSAWADIRLQVEAAMSNQAQPMTPTDYATMTSYYRIAFLNTREGSGSEESWSLLAHGISLCTILAEYGLGLEWMPLILEAHDALNRAKARGQKTDAWRLDGAGMRTVGDVLDVFESQLEIATRRQIIDGQALIMQRLDEAEAAEINATAQN